MPPKTDGVVLHTDGGSRGNPGPAAAAAVALLGGRAVSSRSRRLGTATNNVAEWEGFLLAHEIAPELRLERVEVRTDSELLARQWAGAYRVKHPSLVPLHAKARRAAAAFADVQVRHVPREENKDADRLVNEALDRGPSNGGDA